jgi:hypothetical protein
MMMAEATLDQKLGTVLRLHEEAFRQLGGVPEEILYDRMKTVWLAVDERGEIVWNPVFLDFARYWGFTPRLCRPYRAQTKGKVESGVKYVRRNFLCGLLGREPGGLEELNAQLRQWVQSVANQRVHGTTHEEPAQRWPKEREHLQQPDGVRPIRIWTKNCGAWHAMPMWPGTAAVIRCRGRTQVKRSGFVNVQTTSKCIMVRSGSPFTSGLVDIVR